jgi:polyhydroxyalkanoate synthesis regulator phasin
MFELIRKSILAGIGVAVVTKEKIEEATRHFVKEGKLSTEEAEKFADEMIKSGEREMDEMNSRISEAMKKWADNIEIVRKKEFQELSGRLDILERRLSALEGAGAKESQVSSEGP